MPRANAVARLNRRHRGLRLQFHRMLRRLTRGIWPLKLARRPTGRSVDRRRPHTERPIHAARSRARRRRRIAGRQTVRNVRGLRVSDAGKHVLREATLGQVGIAQNRDVQDQPQHAKQRLRAVLANGGLPGHAKADRARAAHQRRACDDGMQIDDRAVHRAGTQFDHHFGTHRRRVARRQKSAGRARIRADRVKTFATDRHQSANQRRMPRVLAPVLEHQTAARRVCDGACRITERRSDASRRAVDARCCSGFRRARTNLPRPCRRRRTWSRCHTCRPCGQVRAGPSR